MTALTSLKINQQKIALQTKGLFLLSTAIYVKNIYPIISCFIFLHNYS
jgi:hypothetical protein